MIKMKAMNFKASITVKFSPSSISSFSPTMNRSRELRAEKRRLIARHEEECVKQQRQIAKMLKKI
jgi:hypothetical protein